MNREEVIKKLATDILNGNFVNEHTKDMLSPDGKLLSGIESLRRIEENIKMSDVSATKEIVLPTALLESSEVSAYQAGVIDALDSLGFTFDYESGGNTLIKVKDNQFKVTNIRVKK